MRFLVAPILEPGAGTGHLNRSLDLVEELGDEARILADGDDGLLKSLPHTRAEVERSADNGSPGNIVVLDRKATSRKDFGRLSNWGIPIGLDEGGPSRRFMPYLIDTLPRLGGKEKGNVESLGFLSLPSRRREQLSFPFRRILVSFGGEDPFHLSGPLLDLLLSVLNQRDITVVEGPAFSIHDWPRDVKVLRHPENLLSHLFDFDIVFTSFGLTCFEALAAGVPVILFNPTRYHRLLSRKLNLPEIGVGRPNRRKLLKMFASRELFVTQRTQWHAKLWDTRVPLSRWIKDLTPSGRAICPVCRRSPNPALERFPKRTYFRCIRCGVVFLLSFERNAVRYDDDYFDGEYRKQYGRTYLQDFRNIYRLGRQRLRIIRNRNAGDISPSLLDVGCAYGPFLYAAKRSGYSSAGIDPCESAVIHVRDVLNIPCEKTSFEFFPDIRVNVLTMWYVIEHFPDLEAVLKKVNRFLSDGGVFAFSTPNLRGISGLLNRNLFLERSPSDHFTIWSPGSARKILRRFGFKVFRTRFTGHHPNRFPFLGGKKPGRRVGRMLYLLSRCLHLGDTFEIYAVKKRSIA